MKPALWLGAALLLGAAIGLLASWPLRWTRGLLPEALRCETPTGTLWHGGCALATYGGVSLGALRWTLHPAALLRGRLEARVATEQPGVALESDVGLGFGGALALRELQGELSLDAPLVSRYAAGLRGRVRADLTRLDWSEGRITALAGRLQADDLVQARDGNLPLGSYELAFPARGASANGDPTGRLRDTGGPLQVEATLRLTAGPGYLLEGQVAARDSAPQTLVRQLAMLGPADREGRRSFAQEATF